MQVANASTYFCPLCPLLFGGLCSFTLLNRKSRMMSVLPSYELQCLPQCPGTNILYQHSCWFYCFLSSQNRLPVAVWRTKIITELLVNPRDSSKYLLQPWDPSILHLGIGSERSPDVPASSSVFLQELFHYTWVVLTDDMNVLGISRKLI